MGELTLDRETRRLAWTRVTTILDDYASRIAEGRVTPRPEVASDQIQTSLANLGLDGVPPLDALDFVADGLWRGQVHTPHPRYFGLFNPAPTTMSVAADALAAGFNPQLAAASHSPFAVEVEHFLIRTFCERLGYEPATSDGTFTSGGAEANHSALLVSLINTFPEAGRGGVRALAAQPVLYVSSESHDSIVKAARLSGLGTDAVRTVPTDGDGTWRLDPDALRKQVRADRAAGRAPFLVVASAGTTAGGTIDDVDRIAEIAEAEGLWLHLDAAWGGTAAIFLPEVRQAIGAFERADSITVDAHKWLSVPMAAGIILTRHRGALERTFRVETGYMPTSGTSWGSGDPFTRSMQWSRRFIGLKVYLSLVVAGWQGYRAAIRDMIGLGELLRAELNSAGWPVVNETALPVVCFVDGTTPDGASALHLRAIAHRLNDSGQAWISTVRLGGTVDALRACITNHRTGADDVRALVAALDTVRSELVSA